MFALSFLSASTPAVRRSLALSTLFVASSLAACGAEATATEPPAGGSGDPFPAQLQGSWIYGVISPTNFHDAYTGEWLSNAYGTSVLFEFAPDGRYKQSILIYTSAYACRMQVFIYNEGRAEVQGDVIKVFPTKGTIRSQDDCVVANNYQRPDNIASRQGSVYGWTFKLHDDGKTYLLIGPNNDMSSPSFFRHVN
jgi:hypothetical protein